MDEQRLDSWKEIASYLGRGVTTVQRWEQDEQLPVHRLAHAKKGSVFAFKSELDAWRAARTSIAPGVTGTEPASSRQATVLRLHRLADLPRAYVSAAALFSSCVLAALGILWARGLAGSPPRADPFPVAATVPRPLANDSASEAGPSISPDGELVVYSWLRPDEPGLYIKPVGGGAASSLALGDRSKFASAGFAKWAPQGNAIAFLAHEPGDDQNTRGLYVVASSGGTPRRLMSISGTGLCWSPDGQSLGFADRASTGEPFSIFAVSIATNQRQRLTTPAAGTFGDTRCAFSPSGRRLAVSRFSSRYQSDLYAIALDAPGNADRLTYDSSGIQGIEWTPDGKAIVFGSHNGLWTIEASGQRQRPALLTGIGNALMQPAFARPTADGRARLVYEHNIRDVNMWRWDAKSGGEGGTTTRIAGSTMWEDHPAFSPDGRRVAFASNRTGNNEIWTANIDGSDSKQLTFLNGPIAISPRWSPDGRHIAFSSQAEGNRDIYLMRADGSRPTRLTWETSQEENPSWSRDGRWIYFRSDRGGIAQLWKIGSEGGSPVRVTSGMASQGFESPDGQLLFFVRSMDVPGLWSVPVGGGAETFVLADVREAFWGVANGGIVFLVSEPTLSPGGPTIRCFDFLSRKVSTLATLPTKSIALSPGFAVSEDARSAVWIQIEGSQSDVMLMDTWRPR
jgi:Tol biopolymer transport system component